jgi:hypothetical protein
LPNFVAVLQRFNTDDGVVVVEEDDELSDIIMTIILLKKVQKYNVICKNTMTKTKYNMND